MTTSPGYISEHELYSLPEAQRRLRIGRHSFRKLRQNGLQIEKCGRNFYITGFSLIETIKKIGAENRQKAEAKAVAEHEQHERENIGAI